MEKRKTRWIFVFLFLLFISACTPNIERLKKKGDVDRLIEIINSEWKQNNWDRYDAAIALGELGDKKAIKPLFEALRYDRKFGKSGMFYNDVLKESLIILGENYPEEIVDYLLESAIYKVVKSVNPERADDIMEVVVKIGPAIVEPLLDAVNENDNDSLEQYALGVFSELGSDIIPILEEARYTYAESLFVREALNNAAGYHSIEAAATAVCKGKSIPGASEYDPSNHGNPRLYVIDIEPYFMSHNFDVWEEYSNYFTKQPEMLQLVICFDEEEPILIETCRYVGGPDVERFQTKYKVSVVGALTGEILAENIFLSQMPRECKQTEFRNVVEINGNLDYGPIIEWLRQFVEP